MKNSIKLLVIFTLLLTTACNSTETTDTNSPEASETSEEITLEDIQDSDWVLYAPDYSAGINFYESEGEFMFISNTEEALGEPSLYTIDPETGDPLKMPLVDDSSPKKFFDFPVEGGPTDADYIGMKLDDEEAGGFVLKSLPIIPFTPFPDNPQTVRPTSGIWNFTMEISSAYLSGAECPTGMRTMTTSGTGNLNVTPDGLNAEMIMDGQNVDFYRVSVTDTEYTSYEVLFPTFDKHGNSISGDATYEFNAPDQEYIEGELFWDNTVGCTGTYPFEMELELATEIPPYIPKQGPWMINIPSFACGSTPITPSTLPNLPFGADVVSISGGGPVPMMIELSNSPISLMQSENSNYYTSFPPNIMLGTVLSPGMPPAIPPMAVGISGTIHAWAQSETSIIGTLTGYGTNGCTFAVPFTMSQ